MGLLRNTFGSSKTSRNTEELKLSLRNGGTIIFNATQPGVGRGQVLGSKKLQTELLFGIDTKIIE